MANSSTIAKHGIPADGHGGILPAGAFDMGLDDAQKPVAERQWRLTQSLPFAMIASGALWAGIVMALFYR